MNNEIVLLYLRFYSKVNFEAHAALGHSSAVAPNCLQYWFGPHSSVQTGMALLQKKLGILETQAARAHSSALVGKILHC
jgi:hypothetical protein